MDIQAVLKKLQYKGGKGAVLNAPGDLAKPFAGAGLATSIPSDADFALIFVKDKAEADRSVKETVPLMKPGAVYWLAYPKGTSGIKTDINRDKLWDVAKPFGYRLVANVAIDEVWSAVRFRPEADVKKAGGS